VLVSDTPPAGAADNTVWFESDTGLTFVRYNDGNSAQWVQQLAGASNPLMRGHLAGLTLSTAGASATFGVAAGMAVDSSNAAAMTLANAITKTTAAWAVGSGNGALDTGTIGAASWYHVFLIRRPDTGVVDVVISATTTPANGPTVMPANYTQFRRIGSMLTAASQWVAFSQRGDEFLWVTGVQDANAVAIGASTVTATLTVPTSVVVGALMRVGILNASTVPASFLITSLDEGTPVLIQNSVVAQVANMIGYAAIPAVRTNTLAQVRASSNRAGNTYYIVTYGWIDRRGRDD
jgi:hypothetical protein